MVYAQGLKAEHINTIRGPHYKGICACALVEEVGWLILKYLTKLCLLTKYGKKYNVWIKMQMQSALMLKLLSKEEEVWLFQGLIL